MNNRNRNGNGIRNRYSDGSSATRHAENTPNDARYLATEIQADENVNPDPNANPLLNNDNEEFLDDKTGNTVLVYFHDRLERSITECLNKFACENT